MEKAGNRRVEKKAGREDTVEILRVKESGDWKNRLSRASRDRRKLMVAAGIVVATAMVLALVIDVWWRRAPVGEGDGGRATLGGVAPGHVILLGEFERVQEAMLHTPELSVRMVVWFLLEAADLYGPEGEGRPLSPEAVERGEVIGRAGPVVVGELLDKTGMGAGSKLAFDRYARAVFLDGVVAASARAELVELAGSDVAPEVWESPAGGSFAPRWGSRGSDGCPGEGTGG